jgi:adenosylcobinamide-GDP ribazoletransferase
VSGLWRAVRYLTIVPIGRPGRDEAGSVGRSAAWFPLVGVAIGAVAAAVDELAVQLFSASVSAVLTVIAWKLLTGGLHLDGLADCLDGLTGRDREHRLAIMRDSRIGAFGALGLILLLLLEITAVADMPATARWGVLLTAPAVGRVMPPLLARLFGAARPGGQGAAFAASVGRAQCAGALAVAALVAIVVLGPLGTAAAALAVVAAAGAAWLVVRRLGGVTGDVLGASIEIAEAIVCLAVLAWLRARG